MKSEGRIVTLFKNLYPEESYVELKRTTTATSALNSGDTHENLTDNKYYHYKHPA